MCHGQGNHCRKLPGWRQCYIWYLERIAPNKLKPAVYSFGLVAVGEKSVIPDGVKIGKNTAISGVTSKEDYPDGVAGKLGNIDKGR